MYTIRMNIAGVNGNAFNLLGAFADAAEQQGWRRQEIDAVLDEAMAGDYDHLLWTLSRHTEPVEQ